MLTIRGGEAWLTCNILVEPEADPDSEAEMMASLCNEWLSHSMAQNYRHGATVLSMHEMRAASEWKNEVARTAQDIAGGKLEKAVLARAVRLEADSAFDTAAALQRLSESYRDCYIFAVASGERCFISATPERLAQVRDGVVKTMSLAGSTRRGATPDEDQALGAALLASPKDQHEHAVVVHALIEALDELCENLEVPSAPGLLKLSNVQHLCTPVMGRLSGDHTLLDVIGKLHPTPAVGGRPREVAIKLIREREGFDRGWYAGPVGWIDQNGEGEFAVALRSALLHGSEATLFAGCGIVADSNPEREYAESILKLKPMLSALGAE
jgi:isochorismate synthase